MSNKEIETVKTSDYLKNTFNELIAISGRCYTELLPENFTKLKPYPKSWNKLIRDAERLTYITVKAMYEIEDRPRTPYRTILVSCYVKGMWNYEVQHLIGYSKSRYQIFKKQAIKEFTIRFNSNMTRCTDLPQIILIN